MILTTIDNLLSKLVRDYPLQEEPPKSYVQEWTREALKLMDNYDQWERKSLVVTIKDYRTPIPGDFYSFDMSEETYEAREQGSFLYFGNREGTFRLHYLAFPTDKEGYILFPDTVEYMDAICYFCVANLCRKRWIINDKEFNYDAYRMKFNDKKIEARADLHLRNHEAQEEFADQYHNIQRGLEQPKSRYARR